ncbi:lectin, galactoside-binding-like b isoform X1 [Vanacampus margaritifer]
MRLKMAVQAAENDAIMVEDQQLNESLGNVGLISPDKEDLARLLTVPFSGRIRGGMRPGKKIIVMGIVDLEPDCFDVSLTCGRDKDKEEAASDVALKLTARFSDRQFLRSARVAGKWTEEEASTVYFPFIPDQPFRVRRNNNSVPVVSPVTCVSSNLMIQVSDSELMLHVVYLVATRFFFKYIFIKFS